MVLLLSAASEMQRLQGQTFTTPTEITEKYMWMPPMPDAKVLVDQLADSNVYLSEEAVPLFPSFMWRSQRHSYESHGMGANEAERRR